MQKHTYLVQDSAALVINGNPVTGCAVRLWVKLLEPHRQRPDVLQVDVKQGLESRPLYLDHHALTVEGGTVHLRCERSQGLDTRLF